MLNEKRESDSDRKPWDYKNTMCGCKVQVNNRLIRSFWSLDERNKGCT